MVGWLVVATNNLIKVAKALYVNFWQRLLWCHRYGADDFCKGKISSGQNGGFLGLFLNCIDLYYLFEPDGQATKEILKEKIYSKKWKMHSKTARGFNRECWFIKNMLTCFYPSGLLLLDFLRLRGHHPLSNAPVDRTNSNTQHRPPLLCWNYSCTPSGICNLEYSKTAWNK